jgi:nitrite reductase/ring-hydroxylating ferredoxin subunit
MLKHPDSFPIRAAEEQRLDRRRFLRAAGAAAAVALGGEWLGDRIERSRARTLDVALDPSAPLALGEARTLVDPRGGEALAVRLDAERIVAFDRRCPHLGCPVLWSAERERFECPCHHAAFDATTGRVLFGPPRRGLTPARLRRA